MESNHYIKSMKAIIHRARAYGNNGFEMTVTVSFDSKEFNKIKKRSCPLAAGMAQIKNVVFDATGVRSMPSYAPMSYNQRFPRASKGRITLDLTFSLSIHDMERLGVDASEWNLYHSISLKETLETTRDDGHLFAKTAIASALGH